MIQYILPATKNSYALQYTNENKTNNMKNDESVFLKSKCQKYLERFMIYLPPQEITFFVWGASYLNTDPPLTFQTWLSVMI